MIYIVTIIITSILAFIANIKTNFITSMPANFICAFIAHLIAFLAGIFTDHLTWPFLLSIIVYFIASKTTLILRENIEGESCHD